MSTESDSGIVFQPLQHIGYTRDIGDVSCGFSLEPMEYYQNGQLWLKIVHFESESYSPEAWNDTSRQLGKPNAGRTLMLNAGDWRWRLNGVQKYLTIGIYEHEFCDVRWFGVHNLADGWETIHQDGSIKELQSGKERSEIFDIAGKRIKLKFSCPVRAGAWTGDDIMYELEELGT